MRTPQIDIPDDIVPDLVDAIDARYPALAGKTQAEKFEHVVRQALEPLYTAHMKAKAGRAAAAAQVEALEERETALATAREARRNAEAAAASQARNAFKAAE